MRCAATTKAGDPCRAQALPASDRCTLHSEDPEIQTQRLEAARRGGLERTKQLSRPSADPLPPLDVADLNLETIEGLRAYVARVLYKLAELPFDVRVANSIGQVINVQRSILETSDLEGRVANLESRIGGIRAT